MPRTGLAMSDSEDSIHESVVSSTTSLERRLNLPDGIRRTISTEEIREYFECPICYEGNVQLTIVATTKIFFKL